MCGRVYAGFEMHDISLCCNSHAWLFVCPVAEREESGGFELLNGLVFKTVFLEANKDFRDFIREWPGEN